MSKIRVKQLDQTELSGYIGDVTSGDFSVIESDIAVLETGVDTLSGFYSDLLYSVGVLSGQNNGISGRLDTLESLFNTFDDNLSTLSGDITLLETATGVLNDYISGVESDLNDYISGNNLASSGLTGSVLSISGSVDNYIYNYILVQDTKASGVGGGTFTAGSWQTRNLNLELSDSGNLCSISSNRLTLSGGLYSCHASAPAMCVGSHMARLYNVSNSSVLLSGTMEYAGTTATPISSRSWINGRFRITGSTGQLVELQHLGQTTCSNSGFGTGVGLADSTLQNTYSFIELHRISS